MQWCTKMHIYEVWVKGLMIRAAVRAQIVDKPSRVDIVDFQAIWLRGQDVAARNGHLLFDEWTQQTLIVFVRPVQL